MGGSWFILISIKLSQMILLLGFSIQFFTCHWMTCIWFMVVSGADLGSDTNTYLVYSQSEPFHQYAQNFYSTLCLQFWVTDLRDQICDGSFCNPVLMVLAYVTMMTGLCLVAFFFATINGLVSFHNSRVSVFRRKMEKIQDDMEYMELPLELQYRISKY